MNSYEYNCIFSPEGKLIQIENALEALNTSNTTVIGRNKNSIVCATKRIYKSPLYDEEPTSVYKISNSVYSLCTGIPADVDQIIFKLKDLYFDREYDLGMEVSPDILSMNLADKAQKLMQTNGERPYCYAMTVFGFDNNEPSIYYTDISAICYPYFAIGMGEKANKINSFLEKNYNINISDSELQEFVVQGLMQAIGEDASAKEIDVYVLEKGMSIRDLKDQEIDNLLQKIADK